MKRPSPSSTRSAPDEPDDRTQRTAPGHDEGLERWATGRLLSTAARLSEHAWDAHLAHFDLGHAGFVLLWALTPGPRSQRELAAMMQVQEQTMGKLVERMERAGFVARERSAADRRRMVVSVTAAGLAVARDAAAGDAAEGIITGALDADETAELRRHLVALVRHLGKARWS